MATTTRQASKTITMPSAPGGIRPGAGHAAQAGGHRKISPSGGPANESLVRDL
jgi:hypothetical protein